MKRILFILLIFILPTFLFSQIATDWGAFNQRIDAKRFEGKRFKLQAAVKVHLMDSSASAEIWVRVDKQNKKIGFFNNMMDKPIRSRDWKIVSIEGRIDKNAAFLTFGGLYFRKGIFYFDDFKLFIETSKDHYEEINISDGNFEQDSFNSNWSFYRRRDGFSVSTSKEEAFEGKQSCKVDGSHFIKKNTFGNNDSTGKYAFVNGIKLYFEEYGTGQPLVLLHGNSASIESFKLQIPEFSKEYRIIAVDTRGQGKSSEDGKTFTYDLFAEDMNALLDYLKLDSVYILGWSDGGNTGLIMAIKYPKKVKKLITMGAVIFIDNTVVSKWVFRILNKQIKEINSDTLYNGKFRLRMINLLLTEPKHKFEDLKAIDCPVLVMAGEKDLIKAGHTRGIAAHIPKSTLDLVPKETHEFPWENPKLFNKKVLDYLSKP